MTIDLSGGLPIEREFVFAEKPGAQVRDAINVWLEEENGEFAMRIGVERVAEEWADPELWLDIAFPDGRVISGRQHGLAPNPTGVQGKPTVLGCGPLRFACLEPFKHSTVEFTPHRVRELTAQQLIDQKIPEDPPMREIAFAIDYWPAVPPLISGTLSTAAVELMRGEQGAFISPRFEQLCRAKGSLTVDGRGRNFSAQLLRVKRQGVRKFEGFWGHCWMSALFPSGRAFGVNAFPPRADGKPSFNEGFVFHGDGELIPARAVQMPWMRRLQTGDELVPLVLETAEGKMAIEGTTFINCRSLGATVLPASFPIVQQAHARYRWDGEEACGMIERSTLREQMQW